MNAFSMEAQNVHGHNIQKFGDVLDASQPAGIASASIAHPILVVKQLLTFP